MSRRALGSITIAACAASWGGIGVVVRELDMPSLAIAFFQELQAAVVGVLVAAVWRPSALRPPRPSVAVLGLLMAAHFVCLFSAVRHTSVASAVLVTYSAPILIALLAPALLREHVSRVALMSLAGATTGVAVIALAGGGGGGRGVHPSGIALALGAAVTYALVVVLLKRWTADADPLGVLVWLNSAAAFTLSPAAFAGGYSIGSREIGLLALLGIVLGGATGLAWLFALRHVPATSAGILGYLEPLSAVVLAAVVLGESPTEWVLVGGAAILAAGAAVVLDDARADPDVVAPGTAAPTAVRRS